MVENFFRSSLGEEDRLSGGILYQDGHHAPREVERDLIQLLVLFEDCLPFEVGAFQNRSVKKILKTCLKVTDQVSVQEYFLRFAPSDVAVPHKYDTALRERARLVGAQHVHAPEILDGVELRLSRLTITFLRLIASAPLERQTDTIIGSISGVRPTATAIAKKKAPFQSCLVRPLIKKTNGTITAIS